MWLFFKIAIIYIYTFTALLLSQYKSVLVCFCSELSTLVLAIEILCSTLMQTLTPQEGFGTLSFPKLLSYPVKKIVP